MNLFPVDVTGPSGQGYQTTRLVAHATDDGLLVTIWRWNRKGNGPVPIVSAPASGLTSEGETHTLEAPAVSPLTGEPQPAGTWTATEGGWCGCGHPFKSYPLRRLIGTAPKRFAT